LSEKGQKEAAAAGKLLKDEGFKFDIAYTSYLKRAIRTCWHVLEQTDLMYIPIKNAWQLNERHYGGLTGLNKAETLEKHGPDLVTQWRRSYDIPPPDCPADSKYHPRNDVKYAKLTDAQCPATESLAVSICFHVLLCVPADYWYIANLFWDFQITLDRVLPYWHSDIVPSITTPQPHSGADTRVLIAAHGNSLRALVKYLDDIPDSEITGLNIPTGVPLVYELDRKTLKPIKHPDSIGPLSGRYLGNQDDIRARILGVANQTKK
jgi:2,3-bisphosphoglycerate-dependent phosphoglycerate mutase